MARRQRTRDPRHEGASPVFRVARLTLGRRTHPRPAAILLTHGRGPACGRIRATAHRRPSRPPPLRTVRTRRPAPRRSRRPAGDAPGGHGAPGSGLTTGAQPRHRRRRDRPRPRPHPRRICGRRPVSRPARRATATAAQHRQRPARRVGAALPAPADTTAGHHTSYQLTRRAPADQPDRFGDHIGGFHRPGDGVHPPQWTQPPAQSAGAALR